MGNLIIQRISQTYIKTGIIVDKLHICHQYNLVHCDIRLTNILICNDKLILADFGYALHEGKVSVFLDAKSNMILIHLLICL
jgi:serine/threonine protein kinase